MCSTANGTTSQSLQVSCKSGALGPINARAYGYARRDAHFAGAEVSDSVSGRRVPPLRSSCGPGAGVPVKRDPGDCSAVWCPSGADLGRGLTGPPRSSESRLSKRADDAETQEFDPGAVTDAAAEGIDNSLVTPSGGRLPHRLLRGGWDHSLRSLPRGADWLRAQDEGVVTNAWF